MGKSDKQSVSEKIAVVGLGYVGLPVALAFARKFPGTVGFDTNPKKVAELKQGHDVTDQGFSEELKRTSLLITSNAEDMRNCSMFIVCVPTPVDCNNKPDLGALEGASKTVGKIMPPAAIVVYESTVYPGVTEEFCGPILATASGLKQSKDFFLGYSPERINPGDATHGFEAIIKVVAGEDEATLKRIASAYGAVVTAGLHLATSIKVAEAAKVIENTQRDLNIALMNELAIIFDRMNISTKHVLEAAGTKWNFIRFTPGLVGGHCIGVDPYYLTTKAEQLGYHPQVILAGRRINDTMGIYVAEKLVKLLSESGIALKGARVAVLGLTFKENVADIRNSRVPDIVRTLTNYGVNVFVVDPLVKTDEAREEYGITLTSLDDLGELDGIVLAVCHKELLSSLQTVVDKKLRIGGVLIDVKSVVAKDILRPDICYWSL